MINSLRSAVDRIFHKQDSQDLGFQEKLLKHIQIGPASLDSGNPLPSEEGTPYNILEPLTRKPRP